MRPLRAAVVIAAGFAAASAARVETVAAPGYSLETLTLAGAIVSGLARDGDTLVFTDLAAGQLYRRGADGALVVFGLTFPHGLDVIGDPTGPYRVARVGDAWVVAEGWTPVDSDEGPYDHAIVAIGDDGVVSVVSSDFWNPFDFVAADGVFYVVDAAKNTVERINSDGGGKTTIVAFGRMSETASAMQSLSPTEFKAGGRYEVDAVPTGVALRADRLYVSLFGGFPFLAGAGKIVSVPKAGGAPETVVANLNAPVDLAFDGDGRLLVLEHGLYDQATGFLPGSGRLVSVDGSGGHRRIVLDDLTRPASVLVWDDRHLVVSELGGTIYFLTRQPAD